MKSQMKNPKISSIFQLVTTLLVFTLVLACGEQETAKVVSRGTNNGQQPERDDKLSQSTGIGIPALAALGFISIKQVSRLLSLAIDGQKSTELNRCQKFESTKSANEKVDLLVVKSVGCPIWQGVESISVTYQDEKRDDKNKITQITKERNAKTPIGISSVRARSEQNIDLLETIKIKSTDKPGVFDFSYNEGLDPDSSNDIVIEQKRTRKSPTDNKTQKGERGASDVEGVDLEKIENRREELTSRGQSADFRAQELTPTGTVTRGQNSRHGQRNKNVNRNRSYKGYVNIIASGRINTNVTPWAWSIKDISVHFLNNDSTGATISDSELILVPQAGEAIFTTTPDCQIPVGQFLAKEVVTSADRDKKEFNGIILQTNETGAIIVANYSKNLTRSNCAVSGYTDIDETIAQVHSKLAATPIYKTRADMKSRAGRLGGFTGDKNLNSTDNKKDSGANATKDTGGGTNKANPPMIKAR